MRMNELNLNAGGLIWITGFSGAGKTTVANIVSQKLKEKGFPLVLLDGDEIRSILGEKFGHTLNDRKQLASIYGRLCKKLADNQITVVMATVAMFESVRKENRLSIKNYVEAYLDVPFTIRAERDSKGIYTSVNKKELSADDFAKGMEVPQSPDLVLNNYGDLTPQDAAEQIIEKYLAVITSNKTDGATILENHSELQMDDRAAYWDAYYAKRKAPIHPSSFALFCNENYLAPQSHILEFGCGNGRDSFYFCMENQVTAIDESGVVVEANNARAKQEGKDNIRFLQGQFGSPIAELPEEVDAVYARFVIHAMPEECETRALKEARRLLNLGGLLLLEFRTNRDPLMNKGTEISNSERITDHYRRFIDFSAFCEKVRMIGFKLEYSIEKQGLATYGDDDPVVARVIARRI